MDNAKSKCINSSTSYCLVFAFFNILSTSDYNSVINFFSKPLFVSLTIILLVAGFFHAKIGLSEIFEDYIQDEKIKNVANLLTFILSIIIPSITIILLLYKF